MKADVVVPLVVLGFAVVVVVGHLVWWWVQ